MPRSGAHLPRRFADPRGTVLVICLLLMVVATFLAGLVLLLARTEATTTATVWGSTRASTAAEYGLEFAANSLDPSAGVTPFPTQNLGQGVQATSGLRDGSSATPVNQGTAACPAGYSLSLGCTAYSFAATGWARGWLVTTASTQLETAAAIYRGCSGTEYSC